MLVSAGEVTKVPKFSPSAESEMQTHALCSAKLCPGENNQGLCEYFLLKTLAIVWEKRHRIPCTSGWDFMRTKQSHYWKESLCWNMYLMVLVSLCSNSWKTGNCPAIRVVTHLKHAAWTVSPGRLYVFSKHLFEFTIFDCSHSYTEHRLGSDAEQKRHLGRRQFDKLKLSSMLKTFVLILCLKCLKTHSIFSAVEKDTWLWCLRNEIFLIATKLEACCDKMQMQKVSCDGKKSNFMLFLRDKDIRFSQHDMNALCTTQLKTNVSAEVKPRVSFLTGCTGRGHHVEEPEKITTSSRKKNPSWRPGRLPQSQNTNHVTLSCHP